MKFIFFPILLISLFTSVALGQGTDGNGAGQAIIKSSRDSKAVDKLLEAADEISFFNPDSAILLSKTALEIARDIHYSKGEVAALNTCGEAYHFSGDYPQALKMQFDALNITRETKDSAAEAGTLGFIGIVYNELGQYRQALQNLLPAIEIYKHLPGEFRGSFELANIGDAYDFLHMRDSAFYYLRKAYELSSHSTGTHLRSFILEHMGHVYAETGMTDSAFKFYHEAIRYARLSNDKLNMGMSQNKIAGIFASIHEYDSAIIYARLGYANGQSANSKPLLLQSGNLLAKLYKETKSPDSAFFFLNVAVSMRDSLYGPEKLRKLQVWMLDEQHKQEMVRAQAEKLKNRMKYAALLSGLVIFLLLAFFLWRNNQHRKRSNTLLLKEKQKVEQAYDELKSAQAQLIQSEKMASLGELTAGIAHEIQNPLNFVNNFSDVNIELVDELKSELETGNKQEAINIAQNLKDNEQKINLHGKRAEAIVKNMLQHSRNRSGQKEPTDINELCDEFLRLAYHGLRAKDKSFHASMKTDFDVTVGKVPLVPQDMGRVFLNLINNAFYAVDDKKKSLIPESSEFQYDPTITVSTEKVNGMVEVRVKDNGKGIPPKVLDKIFQPFFTTKPTGVGTGLGLSLSYDIVKAHGGELKVETIEGEGSTFIIQLPVN